MTKKFEYTESPIWQENYIIKEKLDRRNDHTKNKLGSSIVLHGIGLPSTIRWMVELAWPPLVRAIFQHHNVPPRNNKGYRLTKNYLLSIVRENSLTMFHISVFSLLFYLRPSSFLSSFLFSFFPCFLFFVFLIFLHLIFFFVLWCEEGLGTCL